MNYTDRQGTDTKARRNRKKGREKNKTKNGDLNTSTTNRQNIISKSHYVRHKISGMT